MNTDALMKKLNTPTGVIDAILDTDAYNEIDDQFALAYMLLSPERINVKGICAAPFYNSMSNGPLDGMIKSYDEILKILTLMKKEDMKNHVFKGSDKYLPDEKTPVMSDAAQFIATQAREHTPDNPLYVVAIGAITNVASAILIDKDAMVNNTVIVWLGGHSKDWVDTKEFNMYQDIAAARVVMLSGAPFVQLPCMGVVSELRTTEWELKNWLDGQNDLATYLYQNTRNAVKHRWNMAWSRVIWDVSAVAWLLNDNDRFMKSYLIPTIVAQYDGKYSFDPRNHPMRYVYTVRRDEIFTDLFTKIRNCK